MTRDRRSAGSCGGRQLVWVTALTVLLVVAFESMGTAAVGAARAQQPTVVSLTFDDGWESQWDAARLLEEHGFRGTFYVNSASLDSGRRLSTRQLVEMADSGHEIGGHTLDHMPLTKIDGAERLRQVCDDRVELTRRLGQPPRSFAYPYGAHDDDVMRAIEECGYSSARTVGGLRSDDCLDCPLSERFRPPEPFAVRTGLSLVAVTTPAGAISQVERAIAAGGWMTFVFHEVCDGCSSAAVPRKRFVALLDYLRRQERVGALRVRTVGEVITAPGRPPVGGPADRRGQAELVNPSFEQPGADARGAAGSARTILVPEIGEFDEATLCWIRSRFGSNDGEWHRVSPGRTGSWAEQIDMARHHTGDMKLMTRMDEGSCAAHVAGGGRYRLGVWYRGSATPHIVAFYKAGSGRWTFLGRSSPATASRRWREVTWTTPALPAGADRLSFGVQLASAGTVVVDDMSIAREEEGMPVAALLLALIVAGLAATAAVLLIVRRLRTRDAPAG